MNHPQKNLRCRSALAVAVVTLVGGAIASAGTAAYQGVILGDSPIVYYELDETSGTTAVNSATTGATYEGTFNTAGGPITVNQASFAQGGTSYDFDGGFVGAASALTNSLDEWTVEAWVNYDSAKTSQSNFLSNDQGGWNNDVLIGIGAETGSVGVPGGSVGAIQQGNPGSTRDAAGAPLVANEWHHVVITGSTTAGTLTVYIDGVQVAQDNALVNGVTFNGADGIGTANLTVGAARPNSSDGGYRPYDGLLDEVAVYDSVLDAATITNHYNVGSVTAGVPPAIVALSPADDASEGEISSELVATFSEPLVLTDNGTVTIRNLTLGSGSDVTITLPDSQVTVSGSTLTINPTADLDPDTSYAVRITADAIEDTEGDAFAGLLDDDGWNFTTAALPGLVGKWEFESEAGGVTPDSSGNGHDGTLEGSANLTVDAERGSVLELSGLGSEADRVNIDSTVEIPTLPAGRGTTLAAWIKRNADASAGDKYAYPIGIGRSGNFPINTIGITNATGFVTGFIEGDSGGNDQVEVIGDSAVTDGVWTHIAITYDRINNEAITYVNGIAQGTPTDISLVADGALDWGFGVIGRNVNGASDDVNHFGGLLDDVCYFDKVLAPGEIQALASGDAAIASFEGAGATGIINQVAKTISLEVPFGTDLTALAPTFTLTSGSCDQTSGAIPSPTFAAQNPVDYVVTDTSTDPDTVNTYSVTVTVAPETATLVIDLGTSPAGTMIEGNTFGTYVAAPGFPANLPLPALPVGSILKSIELDTRLEATDNENFASDLAVLFDPTPGAPGGDFSLGITNGEISFGQTVALGWPASANAGAGTDLDDTKTDADWAAAGPIDLATTGLFLGNAFGGPTVGGTWSGTITLTYLVASGGNSFSDWIDTYFPGQTDPAIIGLDADPDGDGIDNGVENFFGTGPGEFSQGLVAGVVDTGASTFTFTHPFNDNFASDLTQTYRWSKDLVTFTPGGGTHDGTTVTITPGTPGGGFVTVTAEISGTSTSKLFVDVLVTQP